MSAKLCVATCPDAALSCDLWSPMYVHNYSHRIPSCHPNQDKPSSLPKPRISSAQLRQTAADKTAILSTKPKLTTALTTSNPSSAVSCLTHLPLTCLLPTPISSLPACEWRFDTKNQNMASLTAMCPKLHTVLNPCSGLDGWACGIQQ
jgi:hypothetical protein